MNFSVWLDPRTRKALERLAGAEERTKGDVIRRLIRLEARKRGLWPLDQPDANATDNAKGDQR